ncbi:MAG: HD domain-containing protein [Solirubrobacteraceae bacterium]
MGASRHAPLVGSGLHQTLIALAYAVEQHAGQKRDVDGPPFVLHPIEVATLLADIGAPDHVVAAGVLHDTLEKTSAEAADLPVGFGPRVTALVLALSEDPAIAGYSERKAALRDQVRAADDEALMVFAADKVSKTRELRLASATASRPLSFRRGSKPQRKLAHYRHCAELLEERLAGSPLVEALRRELAELTLSEQAALVGAH